jgi:hypothetical protein
MSTLQAANLKNASSVTNNIVLDTSGNTTISGNAVISGSATVGGVAVVTTTGTQTLTNKTLTSPTITGAVMSSMASSVLTLDTAKTATGAFVDFTGIPSWARRITVMFNGVSTNGSSNIQIQIGTSSGFVATGYSGAGGTIAQAGTSAVTNISSGFLIEAGTTISVPATVRHGRATILNISGNSWIFDSTISNSVSTVMAFGAGGVALSGTADRVRVTTINGTDQFDAGTINVMWE